MIGPDDARSAARKRLATRLSGWVIQAPDRPALTLSLKPPTERAVLRDQSAAEAWVQAWASTALPDGAELEWATPAWRSLGRQRIPVRLQLADPDAVAAFAAGAVARDWRTLSTRVAVLRATLGASEALDTAIRRHAAEITAWTSPRFEQVVDVVAWLSTNSTHGLRPRQIPIRGVDTKWLAAHRSVVTRLHAASTGAPDLGLVDADPLVRIRILDPSLLAGGVSDFAAPASQVAALPLAPRVVFVFENLESVLALPFWEGAVAIHGSGYAVDIAGDLDWVARSPVVYWGDLDSHGFAIAHRLRTHLPHLTTALMDEATLLAHRDLWVSEPKPTRARLDSLTPLEAATLARLRTEGDVRLEQERIPWAIACAALEHAEKSATG